MARSAIYPSITMAKRRRCHERNGESGWQRWSSRDTSRQWIEGRTLPSTSEGSSRSHRMPGERRMDRVVSTGPFSLHNGGRRQSRDQHQRHLWPYQQKWREMEAERRRMAQFRGVVLMRGATEEYQRVTESVRTSVNIPLASTEFATTSLILLGVPILLLHQTIHSR